MNKILKEIDGINDELIGINKFIYDNPELGNEEYLACKAHINILRKYDFEIVEQFLDIETAFKATYDSKKPGPTIAVMAEYDALPGIGHGCGHNWIGTVASGVGIVLRKHLDEMGGMVIVLGTPAEETNGAKVDMADQGVFDDIDIALMAHPSDATYVSIESLALEAIEFEFIGKTSHAAASPEKGINALDAVIATFNSINALREHVVSSTRIHGIITDGGVAANIVPEKAVTQFYVRAPKKSYLKEVVEKVKNCARGAALATGAELSIRNYEKSYDNFVANHKLNDMLEKNFKLYDIVDIQTDRSSMGSLDAGNVSHVCPTVHPLIAITKEETISHTRAFADATLQPYAIEQMKKTIAALTQMGIDIIKNPNLLLQINEEFKTREK